jgi:uncharacterized membrane protein YobD (UPF0266 family)
MICLIGGIVLLGLSLVQKNLAYTSFGPAAVPGWGQGALLQAGILFLIAAVILTTFALRRKYGLVINKEGLTFYRPVFSEVFVPWMSVRGITFSQEQYTMVARQRDHRAVLWLEESQKVSLKKYAHPNDLPDLVTRIKAELYPQLEMRFRNSLHAGETISFGPVGLNKNGLFWQNQHHPWAKINRVYLEKGVLVVEMPGQKTYQKSIHSISNLEILILLIREFENN